MLLANLPDLQVLMLRRRAGSEFVGGMSVFPGGGLDAEDASGDAPEAQRASERLGLAEGGLAYSMAAIRETFEETGILLAREADGSFVDLREDGQAKRFHAQRGEVDAGRLTLAALLEAEALRPATDSLSYVGRWITPLGPPRRYDTRFFVAPAPPGQQALADQREAVDSEWVSPANALARFEAGELLMLPPTVSMLRVLAGFADSAAALAAARDQQEGVDRQVRMIGDERSHWRVLLPGEADYQAGKGRWTEGWLRWSSLGDAAGR